MKFPFEAEFPVLRGALTPDSETDAAAKKNPENQNTF
jgi:hypothetical protein